MFRVIYKGVPVECDTIVEVMELARHLEEDPPLALPSAPQPRARRPRPPVSGDPPAKDEEESHREKEVGDGPGPGRKPYRPRIMALDRFKAILTLIEEQGLTEGLKNSVIARHLNISATATAETIRQLQAYLKRLGMESDRVFTREIGQGGACFTGKAGGIMEAQMKIQAERERALETPGALMVYRRAGGKL